MCETEPALLLLQILSAAAHSLVAVDPNLHEESLRSPVNLGWNRPRLQARGSRGAGGFQQTAWPAGKGRMVNATIQRRLPGASFQFSFSRMN